jgi:integrase
MIAPYEPANTGQPKTVVLHFALERYLAYVKRMHPRAKLGTIRPAIRNILTGAEFHGLAGVTEDNLSLAVEKMRDDGFSNTHVRYCWGQFRQFINWLCACEEPRRNPITLCKPPADDGTRARIRRVAYPGEMQRLCAAAEAADDELGWDRSLAYRLAACAGLRIGDMKSLTKDSFFLGYGILVVEATAQKSRARLNGEATRLPIHPTLLVWLKAFFTDRDYVWRLRGMFDAQWTETHYSNIRAGLHRDLLAARAECPAEILEEHPGYLEPVDPKGRLFDFTAMRHTFCTELARAGCAPVRLQKLARHANFNTTLKYYVHLDVEEMAEDLAKLPSWGS